MSPGSPTLREKHKERESLLKENFELRMRLFYMKERLNSGTSGTESEEGTAAPSLSSDTLIYSPLACYCHHCALI